MLDELDDLDDIDDPNDVSLPCFHSLSVLSKYFCERFVFFYTMGGGGRNFINK